MTDAIRVENLLKRFEDVTAVDRISFSVPQGELFGLLGPNGAGKTTTINILSTLIRPTSGTAEVGGYEVTRNRDLVRKSIGIVFQEPALDGKLTGRENLEFHAMMYGLDKAERRKRIAAVLDLVELSEKAAVLVEKYSGGMKRRLEIARGLIHRPKVLFLDEPTLGLDAQTRRHIWEYVRKLNKESGVTIILTTHYMEEADFLCDRIAIMDHGKFVALDTAPRLKDVLGGDVVSLEIESGLEPFLARARGLDWNQTSPHPRERPPSDHGPRRAPHPRACRPGPGARGRRFLRPSPQAEPRGRLPPLHRPDDPRRRDQRSRAEPRDDESPRETVMAISGTAVYVLWLREMKRYARAKSRIIGSLIQPLFFLAFLGLGFNRMAVPGVASGVDYIHFLVPGIIGMSLLFSSSMQGLSVLWDREFGFLKEIMVAPVSRLSIVLGRIAGGTTTTLIQASLVLIVSLVLGFRIRNAWGFGLGLVFMVLIAFAFIGMGLIFASRMKDMQGFGLIMNFVIFPLFFLSGALYPLKNLPVPVRVLSLIDPLTYGIDGLRGCLIGSAERPILIDLAALAGFAVLMLVLGAYFFEKSESV